MPEFMGATYAELISYAYTRDPTPQDPDNYDIVMEFSNLFPCIDFVADFVFTVGTIPVKVTDIYYEILTGEGWIEGLINNGIYATMRDPEQNPVELCSQIHRDEEITVELHIHLPQNDDLQGVSGSGYARLEIQQWNEECDGGTTPDKIVNLPDFTITSVPTTPGVVGPSYWDHAITGTGYDGPGGDNPYNVWDDTWVGWCVSEETYIVPGQTYTFDLMSSYDPANPWEGNYDWSWFCVNYIINNKPQGATWQQIQKAIWYFIDGGYSGSDQVVLDLIEDAETNGKFFIPQEGQWIAVLCIPNPDYQHGYTVQKTFIEVDP